MLYVDLETRDNKCEMARAHWEGKKDGVNNKLQSSGVGQHMEGQRVEAQSIMGSSPAPNLSST